MQPLATIDRLMDVVPKLIENIESICSGSFHTSPKKCDPSGRPPRAMRIDGVPQILKEKTPEEIAAEEAYIADLNALLKTQASLVASLPIPDNLLEGFKAQGLNASELYEVVYLLSNRHPEKKLPGSGLSLPVNSRTRINMFGWKSDLRSFDPTTISSSLAREGELSRVKRIWESTSVSLQVVRGYFSTKGSTPQPKSNSKSLKGEPLSKKIVEVLSDMENKGKRWTANSMWQELLRRDPSVKTNRTYISDDPVFKKYILLIKRNRGPREPKKLRIHDNAIASNDPSAQ